MFLEDHDVPDLSAGIFMAKLVDFVGNDGLALPFDSLSCFKIHFLWAFTLSIYFFSSWMLPSKNVSRAIRHPASGYVQGINDLVTPFLMVFLSEHLDGGMESWSVLNLSPQKISNVEADCYWCLSKLLDGMQDHYTFAQPGIQRLIFKLKELVHRIDGTSIVIRYLLLSFLCQKIVLCLFTILESLLVYGYLARFHVSTFAASCATQMFWSVQIPKYVHSIQTRIQTLDIFY